jgi:hypothetical protein
VPVVASSVQIEDYSFSSKTSPWIRPKDWLDADSPDPDNMFVLSFLLFPSLLFL